MSRDMSGFFMPLKLQTTQLLVQKIILPDKKETI